MSNDPVIEQVLRDNVAVIRITRPETKNSLTLAQIEHLHCALRQAIASPARCLMLTGSGAAFCAGRDLKQVDPKAEDTYRIMTSCINPLLQTLRSAPIPTVAAVQGPALGLGLGLALACDITLAAETATFGSPFRHFGGVPDSGGHFFLAQRIGTHRAAELIFTGRLITAVTAATLGLINRALPAPHLEEHSWQLCRDIAAGPTAAFRASKHILAESRTFDEILDLEARSMDAALKGTDGHEGLRAFREKRRPQFIGR
jgi:2-(1,2-epoxy-1,2-dihydrophenyl)acetyl-CoA isomerase